MKKMSKIFIEQYGCTANLADSEIARGLLRESGFKFVDSPKESDINVIFTCAVKEPTEKRMIYRIKQLEKTNKPLVIAGCLPKSNPNVIRKINGCASLVGPDCVTEIVDVVRKTLRGERIILLEKLKKEKILLPHIRTNPIIDIVQVSSGCLSKCSFCATKLARGNLFSYRPYSIREHVKKAVKNGAKEIWLTSQDMSAYGRDIRTNLVDLLESLVRIDGEFFIRIGMMNPLHFKKVEIEKLIEIYKHPKIFKFLHLCVQSGSNKVLKIMRRGYTVEDFVYYVERFREEIPEITLSTDIIVGHPGESGEDFEKTVKLLKEIKPDIVNLSKFGARPGTLASKMEQIDRKIIKERSKKLHEIIKKITLKRNKKWIGWEGKVLIDEKTEKGFQGRNYAYKPIAVEGNFKLGDFVNVRIVDVKSNYLIGKL
jgi:MiaB-like tRNA modifying enzyme